MQGPEGAGGKAGQRQGEGEANLAVCVCTVQGGRPGRRPTWGSAWGLAQHPLQGSVGEKGSEVHLRKRATEGAGPCAPLQLPVSHSMKAVMAAPYFKEAGASPSAVCLHGEAQREGS